MSDLPIYFSDIFSVSEAELNKYGALDISLISDMPLFIDPFLLFNSDKEDYVLLHQNIIKYIVFLKEKSKKDGISKGLVNAWYRFPEEKANWLGFTAESNKGRGLGPGFARSLHASLQGIFSNFGEEELLESAHLEKFGLLGNGVGKDNISDFTTNLIKEYLLDYTQKFALEHINDRDLGNFSVDRVFFNYLTESWVSKVYRLPKFNDEYVLLTPIDILRQDDVWISRHDLFSKFNTVINTIQNDTLRDQLNNYLTRAITADTSEERRNQKNKVIQELISKYPDLLDLYMKLKEESASEASTEGIEAVEYVRNVLIRNVRDMVSRLVSIEEFREALGGSLEEAIKRVKILKDFIENQDGWRFFYDKDRPRKSEGHLQLMYRLTWHGSYIDVNREVNNGRGPVDYVASIGSFDKTLIEFKLASNTSLRKNLANQVQAYERASHTNQSIKVIMFFNETEQNKVIRILTALDLHQSPEIFLIDASPKESASKID